MGIRNIRELQVNYMLPSLPSLSIISSMDQGMYSVRNMCFHYKRTFHLNPFHESVVVWMTECSHLRSSCEISHSWWNLLPWCLKFSTFKPLKVYYDTEVYYSYFISSHFVQVPPIINIFMLLHFTHASLYTKIDHAFL